MREILKLCRIAIVACFGSVQELWIALSVLFRKDFIMAFIHLAVATLSPEVAGWNRFTSPIVWFRAENVIETTVAQHDCKTRAQLSWDFVVALFHKNDAESMAKLVGTCILPLLLSFGVLHWAKKRFGDSHEWIWHKCLTWMLFCRCLCAVDGLQGTTWMFLTVLFVMSTLVRASKFRSRGVSGMHTLYLLPVCASLCVIFNRISVRALDASEPGEAAKFFTEICRKLSPVLCSFCLTKLFPVRSAFRVKGIAWNNVGVLLCIHIFLPDMQMDTSPDEGCKEFSIRFEEKLFYDLSPMPRVLIAFIGFQVLSYLHGRIAVLLSGGDSRRMIAGSVWHFNIFVFFYVLGLCMVRLLVLVVNTYSIRVCSASSGHQHNVREGLAYLGSLVDVLSYMVMWWTVENSLSGAVSINPLNVFVSAFSPVETIFSWYASFELLKAVWLHQGILAFLRYVGAPRGGRAGGAALHSQQGPPVPNPGALGRFGGAVSTGALGGRGTQKRIKFAGQPQPLLVSKALPLSVPKAAAKPVPQTLPMPLPQALPILLQYASPVSRKRGREDTIGTDDERPSKRAKLF